MTRRLHLAALLAALACCGGPGDEAGGARPASYPRSLIILGVDGMDPNLVQQYWQKGELPNLKALAERGSFQRLATSDPPQSPVAWSTFITGAGPSHTGIYDFVHRDPRKLAPYLSTSRASGPGRSIDIGSLRLPLGSPDVELLRGGESFWDVLDGAGVPTTVVKIPANFPAEGPGGASESLSGMGTPDLLGTYGTFQIFTDDPKLAKETMNGGIVHRLAVSGQRATSSLTGPPSPLSSRGEAMTLPLEVVRDRERDVALVRIGDDTEVMLTPGEWSRWVTVSFDPGILGGAVSGIVRLHLATLRPQLRLYVSPINLDPRDPAMPLSSPPGYVSGLASDIGLFYTQGMPEDTKALADGALSDDEYLAQDEIVWRERHAMLERELDRFHGGVLFFYISSIDPTSHMFWRAIKPDASPEDARYADVIPRAYRRVDAVVGEVMKRLPEGADLMVMSDHGFGPYNWQVHLNSWLAQEGYLATMPPDKVAPGPLGHIDWSRTQAYALGLNQLFINRAGREAHGVVSEGDAAILIAEIKRKLQLWRHAETGAQVVTRVVEVDRASFPDRAPDLIVGYNRGYRSSDDSALGAVDSVIIAKNTGKWSGDHCIDSTLVPGVLFSTIRHVAGDRPSLADLAPAVLRYFDLGFEGRDTTTNQQTP